MSGAASAWLLDTGSHYPIAIGKHELLEVMDEFKVHPLPCGPEVCQQVVIWREQLMPLLDLRRLDGAADSVVPAQALAAVFAWQATPGQPLQHAAILLNDMPLAISVDDDQALPMPAALPALWRELTLACIEHDGHTVILPALDSLLAAPSPDPA